MKKYAALLCAAALLLTGCSREEESHIESDIPVSAEAAVTTNASDSYEAPAGVHGSETVTDTAEAPAEDIYTPLSYVFEEQYWSFSDEISEGVIEEQLGYDTPVDVTQLEEFEYAQNVLQYLETEEEKQQLINNNYSYMDFSICYIGSEKADWLYGANYYVAVDGPPAGAYYSKLFYVKDGVIAETVTELADCYIGEPCYWGESLLIPTDNAIYKLERGGVTLTKLVDAKEWVSIKAAEDEYVIYSDGEYSIKVYYPDSGEIYTTDIYDGRYDGDVYFLTEDHLIYKEIGTGVYKQYDILARELSDADITSEDWDKLHTEYGKLCDGRYSAYKTADGIEITDIITGEAKLYSFAEMAMQYGMKFPQLVGLDNGVLYMEDGNNGAYMVAAFDIASDTAYMQRFEGDGKNHGGFAFDCITEQLSFCSFYNETAAAITFLGEPTIRTLKLSTDETLQIAAEIGKGDIEAQIGYDTPVDVTQLADYEEVEYLLTEFDDETVKLLADRNYSFIGWSKCWLGTDSADWLYIANYYLIPDEPYNIPYYSRIFYVKDGIVADTVAEFYDCYVGETEYWGEDVLIPVDTGVYLLSRSTGEFVKLADSEYWCKIQTVQDDYFLFYDHSNKMKIYYRDSGEVFTTDIYRGLQDPFSYVVIDDVLTFCDYMNTQKYRSFDINTREYISDDVGKTELDRIYEQYETIKNERYSVSSDGCITVISTGKRKIHTLEEYGIDGMDAVALNDSILYYVTADDQIIAADVEADTAIMLEYDKEKYGWAGVHYDPLTDTVYLSMSGGEEAAAIRWSR